MIWVIVTDMNTAFGSANLCIYSVLQLAAELDALALSLHVHMDDGVTSVQLYPSKHRAGTEPDTLIHEPDKFREIYTQAKM